MGNIVNGLEINVAVTVNKTLLPKNMEIGTAIIVWRPMGNKRPINIPKAILNAISAGVDFKFNNFS